MASKFPEYEIRLMKEDDIPQVVELRRDLHRYEGLHSINTWFKHDPEGFYVAATKDGQILASCSVVLHHEDLAFIGMYCVKSQFRGRRIVCKIWSKVLERTGCRNAGLNSAPKMFEKLKYRAGFSIQSTWLALICVAEEVPTSEMLVDLPGININYLGLEDIKKVNAVAKYDADVIGFTTGGLVPLLCNEKDSLTVVATKLCDDSLCGYGIIKKDILGKVAIGPLFADDCCVAEVILYQLLETFPDAKTKTVSLNIVDCNQDSLKMVTRLGFKIDLMLPRLYNRKNVDASFQKIFALHDLNFSVF